MKKLIYSRPQRVEVNSLFDTWSPEEKESYMHDLTSTLDWEYDTFFNLKGDE